MRGDGCREIGREAEDRQTRDRCCSSPLAFMLCLSEQSGLVPWTM